MGGSRKKISTSLNEENCKRMGKTQAEMRSLRSGWASLNARLGRSFLIIVEWQVSRSDRSADHMYFRNLRRIH